MLPLRAAPSAFCLLVVLLVLGLAQLATSADVSSGPVSSEQFHEELFLRSLPDGKIQTRFEFVIDAASPSGQDDGAGGLGKAAHYTLLPRTLTQILRAHFVSELHLTFTAGRWDYLRWGYPAEDGTASGVELLAWLEDGGTKTVKQRWRGLTNSLAGLFCASLNAIDDTKTTMPTAGFHPQANISDDRPKTLLHAFLPSETVCTENLTPFLKLLPCKHASGLASLMNAHKLFSADYHGMGIHFFENDSGDVRVRLAFEAVFDPIRQTRGRRDWSFESLFDRQLIRACPIATSSQVRVGTPQPQWPDEVPQWTIGSNRETLVERPEAGEDVIFNSTSLDRYDQKLDVNMRWPSEHHFDFPSQFSEPPLWARRALTGFGQERGKVEVDIRNAGEEERNVSYLEELPWLVKPYLHTLEVKLNDEDRDDLLLDLHYEPPVTRSRPMLLEASLHLPPRSTVRVRFDFDKAFLRYTEHPPDAHRGFDLPPAVIIPLPPSSSEDVSERPRSATFKTNFVDVDVPRIFTTTALLELAVPDFSMPYNVIILSSTILALFFGSVFNMLIRRFVTIKL